MEFKSNLCVYVYVFQYSLVAQTVKHLPEMQETRVRFLGREDSLEKETATQSSISLANSKISNSLDRAVL